VRGTGHTSFGTSPFSIEGFLKELEKRKGAQKVRCPWAGRTSLSWYPLPEKRDS